MLGLKTFQHQDLVTFDEMETIKRQQCYNFIVDRPRGNIKRVNMEA